jgi:hypothetical protein
MVNWFSVVANGFWILGSAVILAGLSYHYWLAQQESEKLFQVLGRRPFQIILLSGLLLVGVGLVATSQNYLQAIPPILLVFGCLVAFVTLRRHPARN